MNKRIQVSLLLIVVFACVMAVSSLLAPKAEAASSCWQVDCNTCCKTSHGTICTQRACL